MSRWMESDWTDQLGWILLHSFWQFSLIAASVYCVDRMWFRFSAAGQYRLLCCGLLLMTICPLATWCSLSRSHKVAHAAGPVMSHPARTGGLRLERPDETVTLATQARGAAAVMSGNIAEAARTSQSRFNEPWIAPGLSWLCRAWLLGVALFSLRLAAGVWGHQQLRRQPAGDTPAYLLERLKQSAKRVGVQRVVSLRLTDAHVGPMVTGWLQPIIVVPASVMTSMSPLEIELLLAHELAHVRRNDCLINLLQVFLETVFFYHPAVWWLSRRVRITREHCCDDLAATDSASQLSLGRALLALEQQRWPMALLSLSASDGDLLNRIRRLSEGDTRPSAPMSLRLATCLLCLLSVASLSWALPVTMPQEQEIGRTELQATDTQSPTEQSQGVKEGDVALGSSKITPIRNLPLIQEDHEYLDLTLEECLAIALANMKPVVPFRSHGHDSPAADFNGAGSFPTGIMSSDRSIELRRQRSRVRQARTELNAAKNAILPKVSMPQLYHWVGGDDRVEPIRHEGNRPDDEGGVSANGPPASGDDPQEPLETTETRDGALDFNNDPPNLGVRRELARIRGASLRLAREVELAQEQERMLVGRLSDAVGKMATHFQLLRTTTQRVRASEREVRARSTEYQNGRSAINCVLQSEQRRVAAEIDYDRALCEYNNSVSYVRYLRGTLLYAYNIAIRQAK